MWSKKFANNPNRSTSPTALNGCHFGGLAVSPEASDRRGDAGVLWGETIHGVLNHGGRLKISNPDCSVRRAIFRCWHQFLHTRKAVAGNVSYTKRLLTAWSKFDGGWIPQNFQVPGVGVPENILMRHYIHSLRNLLFIGKNLGFCYLERLLIADGFLVNVHSKICLPFSPGELNHEISFKTLRQMFGSSPVMGSTKSIKVG